LSVLLYALSHLLRSRCPLSVNLALSLHAATQESRLTVVPTAKAYKLSKIMEAMEHYWVSNAGQLAVSALLPLLRTSHIAQLLTLSPSPFILRM
jgi:adenine C2-methylase RlmN of 23S rRNA A2503 and tRNA A37